MDTSKERDNEEENICISKCTDEIDSVKNCEDYGMTSFESNCSKNKEMSVKKGKDFEEKDSENNDKLRVTSSVDSGPDSDVEIKESFEEIEEPVSPEIGPRKIKVLRSVSPVLSPSVKSPTQKIKRSLTVHCCKAETEAEIEEKSSIKQPDDINSNLKCLENTDDEYSSSYNNDKDIKSDDDRGVCFDHLQIKESTDNLDKKESYDLLNRERDDDLQKTHSDVDDSKCSNRSDTENDAHLDEENDVISLDEISDSYLNEMNKSNKRIGECSDNIDKEKDENSCVKGTLDHLMEEIDDNSCVKGTSDHLLEEKYEYKNIGESSDHLDEDIEDDGCIRGSSDYLMEEKCDDKSMREGSDHLDEEKDDIRNVRESSDHLMENKDDNKNMSKSLDHVMEMKDVNKSMGERSDPLMEEKDDDNIGDSLDHLVQEKDDNMRDCSDHLMEEKDEMDDINVGDIDKNQTDGNLCSIEGKVVNKNKSNMESNIEHCKEPDESRFSPKHHDNADNASSLTKKLQEEFNKSALCKQDTKEKEEYDSSYIKETKEGERNKNLREQKTREEDASKNLLYEKETETTDNRFSLDDQEDNLSDGEGDLEICLYSDKEEEELLMSSEQQDLVPMKTSKIENKECSPVNETKKVQSLEDAPKQKTGNDFTVKSKQQTAIKDSKILLKSSIITGDLAKTHEEKPSTEMQQKIKNSSGELQISQKIEGVQKNSERTKDLVKANKEKPSTHVEQVNKNISGESQISQKELIKKNEQNKKDSKVKGRSKSDEKKGLQNKFKNKSNTSRLDIEQKLDKSERDSDKNESQKKIVMHKSQNNEMKSDCQEVNVTKRINVKPMSALSYKTVDVQPTKPVQNNLSKKQHLSTLNSNEDFNLGTVTGKRSLQEKAYDKATKVPKLNEDMDNTDEDVEIIPPDDLSIKSDVEYIELSSDDESVEPSRNIKNKVCNRCLHIWNDGVLNLIFKGTECVTVNSKITYGAIVCINDWINRNQKENKEESIVNVFERADLGRNIAKLNIENLDQWLEYLLSSGKQKCCDVFTAVYTSDTPLQNKAPISLASRKTAVLPQNAIPCQRRLPTNTNLSQGQLPATNAIPPHGRLHINSIPLQVQQSTNAIPPQGLLPTNAIPPQEQLTTNAIPPPVYLPRNLFPTSRPVLVPVNIQNSRSVPVNFQNPNPRASSLAFQNQMPFSIRPISPGTIFGQSMLPKGKLVVSSSLMNTSVTGSSQDNHQRSQSLHHPVPNLSLGSESGPHNFTPLMNVMTTQSNSQMSSVFMSQSLVSKQPTCQTISQSLVTNKQPTCQTMSQSLVNKQPTCQTMSQSLVNKQPTCQTMSQSRTNKQPTSQSYLNQETMGQPPIPAVRNSLANVVGVNVSTINVSPKSANTEATSKFINNDVANSAAKKNLTPALGSKAKYMISHSSLDISSSRVESAPRLPTSDSSIKKIISPLVTKSMNFPPKQISHANRDERKSVSEEESIQDISHVKNIENKQVYEDDSNDDQLGMDNVNSSDKAENIDKEITNIKNGPSLKRKNEVTNPPPKKCRQSSKVTSVGKKNQISKEEFEASLKNSQRPDIPVINVESIKDTSINDLLKPLGLNACTKNIYSSYGTNNPVTNAMKVREASAGEKTSSFYLDMNYLSMLMERSALNGYALVAFDHLLYEHDNHELDPSSQLPSSMRYLTKRELLTLQSIFILNAETPDVDIFYQVLMEILMSRKKVLMIPDSRTLLVVTEVIRKDYNRARSKDASVQILNEDWDPYKVFSCIDIWLHGKLPDEPTVRDVLSIFCSWKNLNKNHQDKSFIKALQTVCKLDESTNADHFGLCLKLYIRFCRHNFEEEDQELTKSFLDRLTNGGELKDSKNDIAVVPKMDSIISFHPKDEEDELLENAFVDWEDLLQEEIAILDKPFLTKLIDTYVDLNYKLQWYNKNNKLFVKRINEGTEKRDYILKDIGDLRTNGLVKKLRYSLNEMHLIIKKRYEEKYVVERKCYLRKRYIMTRSETSSDPIYTEEVSPQIEELIYNLLKSGVIANRITEVINIISDNFDGYKKLKLPSEEWIEKFANLVCPSQI